MFQQSYALFHERVSLYILKRHYCQKVIVNSKMLTRRNSFFHALCKRLRGTYTMAKRSRW